MMTKKAKAAVVHPNSRKAEKLVKKKHHDSKVQKRRKQRDSKADLMLDRMVWFHDVVQKEFADKKHFSAPEIRDLVNRYHSRFNIKSSEEGASSSGSFKGVASQWEKEREKNEFCSEGLEVPDLAAKDNVENLRLWDRTRTSLPRIRLTRVQMET